MVSTETVLAGFNIVPVIIFLVVIGKIIKTLKEASSRVEPPSAPPADRRKQKLEQDLESFFERLAGQNSVAEQAPPPVPVARSVPRSKPAVRETAPAPPRREPRRASPVAADPRPQVTQPRPLPLWGEEDYGLPASVPKGAECNYGPAEARRAIVAMIKDEESLRKAVLLREILGPPVSLRHN